MGVPDFMSKKIIIKNRKLLNVVFRTVGNTFIILALFFLAMGFWPYLESEFSYNWNQLVGQKYVLEGDQVTAPSSPLGALVTAPQPISIVPESTEFGVIIPKLNVNTTVVQDVNAANEKEYFSALEKGAAHAKGTVFPGQFGNSFIFAHSTLNFWDVGRYKAVFTLLRKLEPGDRIITFYQGQRYDYQVTQKKVVEASDITDLTPAATGKRLTLQTCDPPGTTLKRLIVIAEAI